MKKIAANRNYRLMKEAGIAMEGHNWSQKVGNLAGEAGRGNHKDAAKLGAVSGLLGRIVEAVNTFESGQALDLTDISNYCKSNAALNTQTTP